jgi:hypothetical protein
MSVIIPKDVLAKAEAAIQPAVGAAPKVVTAAEVAHVPVSPVPVEKKQP